MGSHFADDARRFARKVSGELGGQGQLSYQLREARFLLRSPSPSGPERYFAVQDYQGRSGIVDWTGLRHAVMSAVGRTDEENGERP